MKTVYSKFYKVDNVTQMASEANFEVPVNINAYIQDLIEDCTKKAGDREYKFDETRTTTQPRVMNIINDEKRDATALALADRLTKVEHRRNEQYSQLKGEIPTGILLVAYVDMELDGQSEFKVIIAKADYTEFIEEITGQKKAGLPTKKKLFKSFIVNVTWEDGVPKLSNLKTYDPKKDTASYWWDDFLELSEVRTNAENTQNAMKLLKKEILTPIKEQHKEAYLPLYNATVRYMRTRGSFDLEYFRDNVFGAQVINDPTFNMEKWKNKITKLTKEEKRFDRVFEKQPEVVKERSFSTELELTPLIELRIKNNFSTQDTVIRARRDEGDDGIFIKSDSGYKFAKGLENPEN